MRIRTSRSTRALTAFVLVVGIGLGVSACGDDDSPSAGGEPAPTASGPASTPPSSTPSSTPSTGTTAPAVPECSAADVQASFAHVDSGAGSRYGSLSVLNTTDASCVVQGYGGLSYVSGVSGVSGDGGSDGQQVGAAADRDPGTPVTRIVLPPGGVASSEVREGDAGAYPKGQCGATEVDGFRFYLPDETQAVFVPHRAEVCTNADVHLLGQQAFAAG